MRKLCIRATRKKKGRKIKMKELTPKEKRVYEYIDMMLRKNGYSPSVRDIQNALGIKSTATVNAYLDRLEEKGAISRTASKSRTIRTNQMDTSSDSVKIPLIGRVAAGVPILATEQIERYIDFPSAGRSWTSGDYYALRVKGESMIKAGINNGDIIICKKQAVCENGDIVVALLDDEATVKTFYRENGHIRLQPENDSMAPIIVDDVIIIGVVTALMRYYGKGI